MEKECVLGYGEGRFVKNDINSARIARYLFMSDGSLTPIRAQSGKVATSPTESDIFFLRKKKNYYQNCAKNIFKIVL